MILLSALLASLTGLVAGERPAQRAQVELSAVAAIVQTGETAAQAADRPLPPQVRPDRAAPKWAQAYRSRLAPAGRELLNLKQSWLN